MSKRLTMKRFSRFTPYFHRLLSDRNRNGGFTLIEMLVVIAIIALIAALLIPAVNGALLRAKRVKDLSNVREIGRFVHVYASENKGFYPPLQVTGKPSDGRAQFWSHRVSRYDSGYDREKERLSDLFRNPLHKGHHYNGDYGANSFVMPYPGQGKARSMDEIENASSVIMVANCAIAGRSGRPSNLPEPVWVLNARAASNNPETETAGRPYPYFKGLFNAVFCDGSASSVRFTDFVEDPEKYLGPAP